MKILIAGIPTLTENYENALLSCHIPCCTELGSQDLSAYGGLLLPGGGDVHPSRFGQETFGSVNINPDLDEAQFALLDAFVRAGKPVLGICRGMQIINIYFGGNIVQDLAHSHIHQYRENDQYHPVRNAPGSALHRLYGNTCTVNSAHHQSCGRIGSGLTVTQVAPDGVPEALEHERKPILGVQWHPERTGFSFKRPGVADGEILIRYFAELM